MNLNGANRKKEVQEVPFWIFWLVGGALIYIGAVPLYDVDLPLLQGIELHIGKIVANIGVVVAFIQLLDKFFYAPLSASIQQRTIDLERTYNEADNLKREMVRVKNDYDVRLAAAEAKARDEIQAYIREAQVLRKQLIDEASEKASEMVKQAQAQIESEKDFVKNQLRLQVVDMTLAATEKIIGENIDDKKNRKLIEQFIDELDVVYN